MAAETLPAEDDDAAELAARAGRTEAARRRSRAMELQAVAIMWLGVALAVGGIGALLATGSKLVAGGMTFGGAGVVLLGLLLGAYGQYLYWRTATS